jgi:hypothetical protein
MKMFLIGIAVGIVTTLVAEAALIYIVAYVGSAGRNPFFGL